MCNPKVSKSGTNVSRHISRRDTEHSSQNPYCPAKIGTSGIPTLVTYKLEYASVVWNSITNTDANKLERIQQKFAALCYNRFLPHVHYSYAKASEYLKLHTLRKRRYHLDALFLIQVYRGLKYCPSLFGLRVPTRYLTDFSMFNSSPSLKTVLLQDVHQLLMLSAGTLTYLKQKLFPLVIFHNNCGTFHILDINSILHKFLYLFFLSHLLHTALTCMLSSKLYILPCFSIFFICICCACFLIFF
jgi:hypothetical protein